MIPWERIDILPYLWCCLPVEVDDRGRIYLQKRLRERFGEWFHVVEYADRLELVSIANDPLSAARDAAAGAFDDVSIEEVRETAEQRVRSQARADLQQSDE